MEETTSDLLSRLEKLQSERGKLDFPEERRLLDTSISSLVEQYELKSGEKYSPGNN